MAKQTIKQSSEAEWVRINFSYCFEKKKSVNILLAAKKVSTI